MCSRYTPPRWENFYAEFRALPPENLPVGPVFPRQRGVFVREAGAEREAVVGQFGLVPWFAKTLPLPYSTFNARFETVPTAASFRDAWRRGQRCLVPAHSFFEPCWETGRNVWWRFQRADGHDWALAGLWSRWTDPATGEIVESYTMITRNADDHPLMARMHKPDPKRGPDQQDKRSVVVLEPADRDTWLRGSPAEAAALVRLAPVETFDAAPEASTQG